jgi:hypothetical protein
MVRHWIRIRRCPGHPFGEVHAMATVPVSLLIGAAEFEIGELEAGTGAAWLPYLLRAVADEMEIDRSRH